MARKKNRGRSRGRKTIHLAQVLGGTAAVLHVGIPFMGAAQQVMKGDISGAIMTVRDKARTDLTPRRLIEASLIGVTPSLVAKGLRYMRVPNPRIGPLRAF